MTRQFDAQSTAEEVLDGIDLSGKRIFITGTSAGLGIESARVMVARGATVVGTARNLVKAREAAMTVVEHIKGDGGFELVELDLDSLDNVRACADRLLARNSPFDIVIANAGIMACPQGKTDDGFEKQFATNHLGHFLLVNRLASLIRPGGRFISMSSVAHRLSDIDLDDLNFESAPYSSFRAYSRSKTANALFAVEFERRHRARDIHAASVHPGAIHETELARHITPEVIAEAIALGSSSVESKSIPQGAATAMWAAFVAPAQLIAGRYCEDCQVAPINDEAEPFAGVRSYALAPNSAMALWRRSEELIGERF